MPPPAPPSSATQDWIADLRVHAELLDGIGVGMCAFDLQDRAVLWNRTFLRVFPEHVGHVVEGEHYSTNLRRFHAARLRGAELAEIESFVQEGLARHRAQTQPFEFEHHGTRLQVSSLPVPGRGRLRVWRPLEPLPAEAVAEPEFGSPLGRTLLECVPEALLVCRRDGRIVWANGAFCSLFGLPGLQDVAGSTIEALYHRAWQRAPASDDPMRAQGEATLRKNLRLAGVPFELPLPGGCCRVIARPTGDGAVFYALMDISAIKRFEADLQLTLDNAGRGIIRYDASGRVHLFNQQAIAMLELPEGLLTESANIADILRFQLQRGDPGGMDGLPRFNAPSGTDLFSTGRYLRRTGAGRVLEISTQALPDGGAVRTYTDVTDYVEAQGALGEKSRALQITLDSMGQGIAAIDSSGRVVFWNRRYQELLNLPDEVLAGQPTMDRLVRFQTDRGDFGPGFQFVEAVARGYVAIGDRIAPLKGPENYLRKTRDGRTLQVATRPLPDGGVVRTFSDITDYVQSQEALATKQVQLGALIRNLPDRVWLKDADGVYLLSNPAHQRLHGLEESQIIGRTAYELFGEQVGRQQQATDNEAMASDKPVSFDFHDFNPDGELRYAEVVKVAMRDEAGRCVGLLGIARDITARKQQETALIRAKEEALEASGAKTRFLSSMSHEIRTPMNAILGMLTLLRGSGLSQRQQDYAGKAEGAAVSLLGLLNDILDFSKIEAGKMNLDTRPFSLEALLSDLSVILSSNVGERDLEVMYDLDPQVPDALVGDDMRLRQILINLTGNAIKFTERGEVVLRTRLVERDALNASVEFSVQDTGIGISLEQQERLFTDYAQASGEIARQFGGTGLGLGICRRLTELMDSRLQLESTPGHGSRFWFVVRMPLAPLLAEAPAVAERPARVLIVDDNALARDTLVALCRAAGWLPEAALDGDEAVQRVRDATSRGLAYDAVFVDWLMPGVDGWQTCARIRAISSPTRTPLVIMVTGQGREAVDQRTPQEQALLDGYLVKPVTVGMLREALRRARFTPEASAPPAPPAVPQVLAGLRLLLAEDNEVNQQIAVELLSRRGAQVEVAGNGKLALDRLAAGASYDAVLMDVQMPVMDGLEATRAIRRLPGRKALPIIAMTANAMDTDRADCLAAGMDDHVAKPFAVARVVQVILRHVVGAGETLAPPAPVPEAPAVFDRRGALERLGDDEGLLDMVLRVFRGNLATARQQMAQAGELPPDELLRVFHSVKGMAANVGALALSAAAAQAEQTLRDEPQAPVPPLAAGVAQAIEDVLGALGPEG